MFLNKINRKIKNFFKKIRVRLLRWLAPKDQEINASELFESMTSPYELRQVFVEERVNYDDIECPPNFENEDDFHIVLADDNAGALALLEIDLEIIIGKARINKVQNDILNHIETFQEELNTKANFDIQKIGGDYATYSIYRKVERHPEYRIDFAILDIIFGGVVYRNDKPLRIDGIALAEYILEHNPEAEIILFTGSDLNPKSKEYLEIMDKFGKDFMQNNVVFKTPDFADRLQKFTNRMHVAYTAHLHRIL